VVLHADAWLRGGRSLGIWDPVEALIQLSPNVFAMFVLLTFVLLAQITTNLTINILPPASFSWTRSA
jgi:NCS1 family nucleobase:cation symporter-1